jgi:hypothetical protein
MFVLVAISNTTAPKILQLRIALPPLYPLGGCLRMAFRPNSSEFSKNNARNINYMAVLIL